MLRLLRPHQWAKNLLAFAALGAAHRWADAGALRDAGLMFVALCLAASAIYVVNDALDVAADRAHPDRRTRPYASGALPGASAWAIAPALLAGAALVAWSLPLPALQALAAYALLALAYCVLLKRVLWLDVLVLAALYVLRVVAGGLAIGVVPSAWLSAFALFLFVSLACAKRYGELHQAGGSALAGRAWRAGDDTPLLALGAACGVVSVLVLALYVNSPDVRVLYRAPLWLWLACPVLLYWLARLWTLAARGELRSDPLLFALRDGPSLAVAAAFVGVVALAS
jgi:4-hydroxybenzoate polyprenyltransferase